MPGQNPATDWGQILLAVLFYGSLFYQTIRRHRQNRPVVLAVLFFIMIMGLGMAAGLSGHPLLQLVVGGASLLLALTILFFIFQDMARWFRSRNLSQVSGSSKVRKRLDSL